MMPVDIYETEDEFILLTDIPGASIEDISILVEEGMLIIKGTVKPVSWEKYGMKNDAVALLQEKPAIRNIHRTFPITTTVLVDKLTARLSDGVLTITLPKVKANCTSTRRVAVTNA
jgi:HSP20 family protein